MKYDLFLEEFKIYTEVNGMNVLFIMSMLINRSDVYFFIIFLSIFVYYLIIFDVFRKDFGIIC